MTRDARVSASHRRCRGEASWSLVRAAVRSDSQTDDIPSLCASCVARHRGICAALDAAQLVALARFSHKHRADKGEELVGEAQSIERHSNLLSGVVKLTKTLPDGRQQIVGLRFAPDFIGRPFRVESRLNAEAATDVSLCSFPRSAIERMMEEQPGLEHRLLQQTLKELDDAREWMVTLGRKTASEKVASFLLLIARNIGSGIEADEQAAEFELPLTRADIADFLGLTIETVSRQFTRLRTDGVIAIENNRKIFVPDLARLEARSGS